MKKLLVLGLALVLLSCQPEKVHKGKRVSLWIQDLKEGPWPSDRWRAALAIGEIGPEARAAIPHLIKALQDHDDIVRWAAARALGRFGPEAGKAAAALQKLAAKDPHAAVRAAARDSLWDIDPEAARALRR
jgi:HEAT repeat protein